LRRSFTDPTKGTTWRRQSSKTQRGFTVGHAGLGQHGTRRGTVKQQVHDGDTVIVDPAGNLSVRF
jgi:hypothetical protein